MSKIKNYFLCHKYPFLKPIDLWTDEVPEDYDYSYTTWDDMPEGWNKAFGKQFLKELGKQVKKDKLKYFKITDIKEKFGTLRVYADNDNDAVNDILYKYERLSERYCINCGKPATHHTTGWIVPVCDECYKEWLEHKNK